MLTFLMGLLRKERDGLGTRLRDRGATIASTDNRASVQPDISSAAPAPSMGIETGYSVQYIIHRRGLRVNFLLARVPVYN